LYSKDVASGIGCNLTKSKIGKGKECQVVLGIRLKVSGSILSLETEGLS
jgi:hypothetical protein